MEASSSRTIRTVRDAVAGVTAIGISAYIFSAVLGIRNPTTVALTLLLVVLASATLSSLGVAVFTSIVGMLVFNYFFLPPVGAFAIAEPQNWIALFAFLVTAIVASQLSSAAKQRAREAVDSRREVSRLFDLSRDILLTTDSRDALPALARAVARRFDLQAVAICLPQNGGWTLHQGGAREITPPDTELERAFARLRGRLEYDARQRTYAGSTTVQHNGLTIAMVPVRLGTRAIGLLATEQGSLTMGALDAVGGVVAIAVERSTLLGQRKAAEALQQRADLAAALLASISHDLRTPLTAVRVAVSNLKDRALPEPEHDAQAELALQEIERLDRLFRDILDMARIDAAGITPDRQWVTPADIIDAALANTGGLLANRRLDINAEASVAIHVDPRLTSYALVHLVENAAMYTPGDSPIAIAGAITDEGLRLVVRDKGPGLDPEELAHLFDRFYRGTSARRLAAGSGMGLAITRGLLAAEGGRVWGENEGGGASFTIVVPGARRPVGAAEA
jgi:two-component system sensor histidine kinase KdpD